MTLLSPIDKLSEGLAVKGDYCGFPYTGTITDIRFGPGRTYIFGVKFDPPINVFGSLRESSEIMLQSDGSAKYESIYPWEYEGENK